MEYNMSEKRQFLLINWSEELVNLVEKDDCVDN